MCRGGHGGDCGVCAWWVLCGVSAGRLDGGHGGCTERPRVDSGAAARPRRRCGGTRQGEHVVVIRRSRGRACPGVRLGRGVRVFGAGRLRAVSGRQPLLGPCGLRALSEAAWLRRTRGGGRGGEASRRGVGRVVGRSGEVAGAGGGGAPGVVAHGVERTVACGWLAGGAGGRSHGWLRGLGRLGRGGLFGSRDGVGRRRGCGCGSAGWRECVCVCVCGVCSASCSMAGVWLWRGAVGGGRA